MDGIVQTTKALADPVRWQIVERLAAGPQSATELGDGFKISAPAISRHLKVLLSGGVVAVESHGRQRVYSLRDSSLSQLATALSGITGAIGPSTAPRHASTASATAAEWRVW